MKSIGRQHPYIIISGIFAGLAVFAFTQQSHGEILSGLIKIYQTRGVLITDYMEVGGIGAAFINASVIGLITVALSIKLKVEPSGAVIMSLFLTYGFALFGKNLFNMIPVTLGVWLYARMRKKPYADYFVTGLLAATISPITSELFFLDIFPIWANIALGITLGALSGFLFPLVSEFVAKALFGYNLYNMGFVGGILAAFFIAVLSSIGIEVEPAFYSSSGNNTPLGILLFSLSALLVCLGFVFGNRKTLFTDLKELIKYSGNLPSDYYAIFGANVYVNMGLLCAFGTYVVLMLGAELNGPTVAGILTMTGFGAFGKHLKNSLPLLLGAVIASFVNKWAATDTSNVLAILFSTGLAPIAGKYGIVWGIITGFLHVCIVHHAGSLANGLNLYNNGFAAGFVVLLMLPIIEAASKLFKSET